jgi:hypothetical protein
MLQECEFLHKSKHLLQKADQLEHLLVPNNRECYDHKQFALTRSHTSTMTNSDCDTKLPTNDDAANGSGRKQMYQCIEHVHQTPSDLKNTLMPEPHAPTECKEHWRANSTTWLDLETSSLSMLPIELLIYHVLPLLSSLDLILFLLSLGYNQWTSGSGMLWTKYAYIDPLPLWLSDWLWDHREYTHTRAAHAFTLLSDRCAEACNDWNLIRKHITFDGDDPPEVYKRRRIENGY